MNTPHAYEPSVAIAHWQEKLNIHFGMSKDEALNQFVEWRTEKKTCQRCEGDKLTEFCSIHLICQEADNVRDASRDDNRRRTSEVAQSETVRANLSQKRERVAIR